MRSGLVTSVLVRAVNVSHLVCSQRPMSSDDAIRRNLDLVRQNIRQAYDETSSDVRWRCVPRLVAVSKTQPAAAVRAAHAAGQLHFGENYPQELIEKAADDLLSEQNCSGLRWRFIGTLQTNKVPKLIGSVQNLSAVESVTSLKLADALQSSCERRRDEQSGPLDVLIQVNTSGEPQKSGLMANDEQAIHELAGHIMNDCDRLRFAGFMTIGALARSQAAKAGQENEDFDALTAVRRRFLASDAWRRGHTVADDWQVELSMGMSADYQTAIRAGAASVRVGSAIFGARA